MASTNEDVVVLATAPLGDGRRLLVVRHLPDRGTVEIGWWDREEGGGAVAPGPFVLELAAEVGAVARMCESGRALRERREAGPASRGRRAVLLSRAALCLLAGLFPAALRKLEALGFGLVQQGDQASLGAIKGHA